MRTPNDYERVVETVSKMDRGHGYNPETDRTFPPTESNRAMYQDAVTGGYISPRRRSWGHSLTAKGQEVLRVLNARREAGRAYLVAGGFDPMKPLWELSDLEMDMLAAHLRDLAQSEGPT